MANILAFWSINGSFLAVAEENRFFIASDYYQKLIFISACEGSDYRSFFKHNLTLNLRENYGAVCCNGYRMLEVGRQ